MAISIIHTELGPDVTVTEDDLFITPALYVAGIGEPNYPMPAECKTTAYHNWYVEYLTEPEWTEK